MLFNYIAHRVNNMDDTADILQEVLIKIAINLNSVSDHEKLRSWIFAITRNAIIDYYRNNAKSKRAGRIENIKGEIESENDIDSTKGLNNCLKGFIKKLPEAYRDIIIDSEINGISQKDLTEKYNLAYPSVRSRVQRGRSRLKEMLLNCCEIEADRWGNILEASSKNKCGEECVES